MTVLNESLSTTSQCFSELQENVECCISDFPNQVSLRKFLLSTIFNKKERESKTLRVQPNVVCIPYTKLPVFIIRVHVETRYQLKKKHNF